MSRGGRREGAGAPTKVPYEARLWIRNRFHELKAEKTNEKTKQRIAAAFADTDINQSHDILRKVPKRWRTLVLEIAKSGKLPDPTPADVPDEVIDAADELMLVREHRNTRHVYFPARRLNGEAPAIRERVAQEATERFSVQIAAGHVKRILDDRKGEFRNND